ncbi:MAG: PhoU domain-containing protein [Bacteroidota bacterium]
MNSRIEKKTNELTARVVKVGNETKQLLYSSFEDFFTANGREARKLILQQGEIRREFLDINDQCCSVVMTEPLMASDMRLVVAILRLAPRFLQISDIALRLLSNADRMAGTVILPSLSDSRPDAEKACILFGVSMRAFDLTERSNAQWVIEEGKEMFKATRTKYENLENKSLWISCRELLMQYFLLSQVNDLVKHSIHIAEEVVFIDSGLRSLTEF